MCNKGNSNLSQQQPHRATVQGVVAWWCKPLHLDSRTADGWRRVKVYREKPTFIERFCNVVEPLQIILHNKCNFLNLCSCDQWSQRRPLLVLCSLSVGCRRLQVNKYCSQNYLRNCVNLPPTKQSG